MADALLILNAGSSSLKFTVYLDGERPEPLVEGQFQSLLTHPRFSARDGGGRLVGERDWGSGNVVGHEGAIAHLVAWGRGGCARPHHIAAVGHRVVHGGVRFSGPVLLDARTIAELEALVPLAPLHQPHSLAAIRLITEIAPDLPQVACFDTAFHRTQPAVAQTFALPRRFADEGVRRYGFHGLSYEYVASVLPEIDPEPPRGAPWWRTSATAQACARCSAAAASPRRWVHGRGRPSYGTRCGALDPGVVLYLIERHGMDARSLEALLYEQSGLLGVSSVSSDMRSLLSSSASGAAEAVDLFVYRVGRELGSLAAALGGLDGSCSRAGSARTPPRSAPGSAATRPGSGSSSTTTRTPAAGRESAVRAPKWLRGSFPTDEDRMIALHTGVCWRPTKAVP
jgi:acetate kinase